MALMSWEWHAQELMYCQLMLNLPQDGSVLGLSGKNLLLILIIQKD